MSMFMLVAAVAVGKQKPIIDMVAVSLPLLLVAVDATPLRRENLA